MLFLYTEMVQVVEILPILDEDKAPFIFTDLPLDMMTAISQIIFSDAFAWMKRFVFWLKFDWKLFVMVQLTLIWHWFW